MSNANKWTANNIPDLHGRVAIVTGANSGIGYETARQLASHGANVILACRSQEKGGEATQAIRDEDPVGTVELMSLDLADLTSVHAFADAFHATYDRLDLLVNNAGVMMPPERWETADGFEIQFGTNHLGHFALTGLLLDLLLATPGSRVVNVSSTAARFGSIDFDNLQADKSYSPMGAYGQSKLANLLFTFELQRRFEEAGVETIATAAHPGWTATDLQRHSGITRILNPIMAQQPEMGALPTLFAATAADVEGGAYIGPGGFQEMRGHPKPAKSPARSHDESVAEQLWSLSENLTGVRYTFQR